MKLDFQGRPHDVLVELHDSYMEKMLNEHLSGSGWDGSWSVDTLGNGKHKATIDYHAMNDAGYYDGYIGVNVKYEPNPDALADFDLSFTASSALRKKHLWDRSYFADTIAGVMTDAIKADIDGRIGASLQSLALAQSEMSEFAEAAFPSKAVITDDGIVMETGPFVVVTKDGDEVECKLVSDFAHDLSEVESSYEPFDPSRRIMKEDQVLAGRAPEGAASPSHCEAPHLTMQALCAQAQARLEVNHQAPGAKP